MKKIILIILFFNYLIFGHPLIQLDISDKSPNQGTAIWINVKASKKLKSGNVFLNKKKFKFFNKDNTGNQSSYNYLTCIGISRYLKPQTTELNFKFNFDDGSSYSTQIPLQIKSANFKKEHITLKPKKRKLNQNKTKRKSDSKIINKHFNVISKTKQFSDRFIWPLKGRVTSEYGTQRVYNNKPGWSHSGIDISEITGKPIMASHDGTVILAERLTIHGNSIMIDHGWGIISIYNHLDQISVKTNDNVKKGDHIGTVGSTGVATGSHLHFGISIQSIRVNPRSWIEKTSESVFFFN